MEENNNEIQLEPKKDNGVKILLIILIVLAVAILSLLSYKIFVLDKKEINKNNNIKEENNNIEEVKEDVDKIANDLFNKYIDDKFITPYGYNLFIGEMSDKAKLYATISNLKLKQKDDYDYEKCSITWYDEDDTLDKSCIILETSKNAFEESYKELFGDKDIKYMTFEYNLNTCKLEDSKINCYANLGGYEGGVVQLVELVNYEKNDNKILINVKTLTIVFPGGAIIDGEDNFTKELTDDETSLFNDTRNISETNKDKLFTKYSDDEVNYTMTFIKNTDDNNYYFVECNKNK